MTRRGSTAVKIWFLNDARPGNPQWEAEIDMTDPAEHYSGFGDSPIEALENLTNFPGAKSTRRRMSPSRCSNGDDAA